MNRDLLLKFTDFVKQEKILFLEDERGLRVDYNLTDEEIEELLQFNSTEKSNDLTGDFQKLVEQIVTEAAESAKAADKDKTTESSGENT